MKTLIKSVFLFFALAGLWTMSFSPDVPLTPVFVADAEAIVGRPLTPVSVAGVARRTTRRAVVYSSSAAAAAPQAAPAPAAASVLAAGTMVSALPSGCESTTVDGTSLFNCGGVMYRPTFQSNNLVYVVQ
ncbi:MAG: hypothetical protein V2I48_02985 [Xanthomonadales bacterium]|jgi:hypothetical protein|nr:hypothetical protein [Xanthomonadales bacterium]